MKEDTGDRIVLSIDIGIKNLAYCLMSSKDSYEDGNNFKIYDWDSINLIDEEYPLCQSILKSGKRKGESCGKQSNIKVPPPRSEKTGTTLYYCSTHNPDKTKYKPKVATKVKNVLLKDKCLALHKALDALPDLLNKPVEVVIEKQMPKNPSMFAMAHLVYSYFLMYGYVSEKSPIRNIRFIHAKNKLQVYDGPPLDCKLKNAYSQRKWYACEYTKWMIRNDPEHYEFLIKYHKKQDDLSDSFLQGVWWLSRSGFVKRRKPIKKVRKKINIKSSKQSKIYG